MKRFLRTATVLILFLLTSPALAGQQGVAFVTAPEQAHTHCFADNADNAFKCAREKCHKAGGQECLRTRWCYPAGWSGIMSINLSIGFHFPTELCGMPNREALVAAFETMCRNWENANQCNVGLIFSPDGKEETADIAIDPKQ